MKLREAEIQDEECDTTHAFGSEEEKLWPLPHLSYFR